MASHKWLLDGLTDGTVVSFADVVVQPEDMHGPLMTKVWNHFKQRHESTGVPDSLKKSAAYPYLFGESTVAYQ